jgi:hypothetical protein
LFKSFWFCPYPNALRAEEDFVRISTRLGVFVVALAAASVAQAAINITPSFTILSGVQDTSNLDSAGTRYRGSLDADGTDGDLYINSVQFVPGAGYDPNIGLQLEAATALSHDDVTYTYGTPISGETHWTLDRIIDHYGAIDSSVAPGIYNFSAVFTGGSSSTATDTLATWNLQMEVFPKIDITLGGSSTPAVIGYGDTTTVQVTLTNNMADRSFITTTWYFGNNGMEQGPVGMQGNFVGNWFDQEILPGTSRTDDHTTWTAAPGSLPPGTYLGNLGIYGGLYNGDENSIAALSPQPTVELIPEPASLSLIGAALALTARRRRA